ncbi:NAD(P)H-binding protein [uncultured Cohaesibacter sp.]|uniref:NAD(P)H-binding protein n=1 Tax=uncultured Cohaesibacter sp. TaxID=1002546 RepID=UPI002930BEED|nr:NAD(P)H-binding protein [uncultured Cohaesibacter sp.]
MRTKKSILILGATGGVGGAVAKALLADGWKVRAMVRDVPKAGKSGLEGVDWVAGDALVRDDVIAAAKDASVIFHGVNPPGYRNWDKVVLPMIDNTIAAAKAVGGARIVLPGTVYNFDPAKTHRVVSGTRQDGICRKGRIRIALEKRLRDASETVPVLILRAGDFFGPEVRSTWFAQAMVKPGRPVRRVTRLAVDVGHSWAYMPDLAETFARLLVREEALQSFDEFVFAGHYDRTGMELIEGIARVSGHDVKLRAFPWWLMRVLAPLVGFAREVVEIEPYWKNELKLENDRLVAFLGSEPHTELDSALRETLLWMGNRDDRPF